MKKLLLQLFMLVMILLLIGCSVDEDGSDNTGGSRTTASTLNGSGQYDGTWRLIKIEEYGYNDYKFNEDFEEDFFDIDSGSELYSDNSILVVLQKDSVYIYMYDPEVNADTFLIEYSTFDLLNEFDPDEYEEEGELAATEENLRKSLISRFMLDSVTGITGYNIESLNDLSADLDTLTLTLGFRITAEFSAERNDQILTGAYECEMAGVYTLVSYDGPFPPDNWPDDYVVDDGSENGG